MEKNKTKKKSVGRPATVNWGQFQLQWRNMTDSEISVKAGCSKVNVFLKRKRLVAKAIAEGKDGAFYKCSRPKWARGKHLVKKNQSVAGQDQPESPQKETVEGEAVQES